MRRAFLALLCPFVGVLCGSVSASLAPAAELTPAQLHSAYELPRSARHQSTVAVIVAYDDSTLEHDLATFSRAYKLPSCSHLHGCLRRVNQQGLSSPLPAPDPSGGNWVAEASTSTQVVHGLCENCRLLVVEASSDAGEDLAAAVDTAVRLGAREVVTTYSLGESSIDGYLARHYDHPGVVITAATGDDGFSYATNVPASYPGVVAVGGTTLRLGHGGRWAGETVWNDSSGATASGCSPFTPAPSWQAPFAKAVGCGTERALADVAAAAAPGVPFYSSSTVEGQKGWFDIEGTSVSSPIIAAVFALAGGVGPHQSAAALLYTRLRHARGAFHDITRGSDGSCSGRPICAARRGYDGPSGVGTPHGLAGF
ncbi:MAG: S8 family serine peptidase [Acidimicrobiia bacterium]|nr:S8 family serine peptidase [Acidimicrobiia bacterium]